MVPGFVTVVSSFDAERALDSGRTDVDLVLSYQEKPTVRKALTVATR